MTSEPEERAQMYADLVIWGLTLRLSDDEVADLAEELVVGKGWRRTVTE